MGDTNPLYMNGVSNGYVQVRISDQKMNFI